MQIEMLPSKHPVDLLKIRHGFYYVATPYSKWPGGMNDAAAHAAAISARLLSKGIYIYSPIAHSHAIALHSTLDPADHSIWLPLDEQFMETAFGLLVIDMPGWRDSYGVNEEIKWFRKHDKPVYLVSPEDLKVQALRISLDKAP
jgi:hypothetical protein